MRDDFDLMCQANDTFFGRGLIQNPGILRNRIIFSTLNNSEEWKGMRFGLKENDNGEKVARMRLDNGGYGQINKYNI
jgi:hypothetical protein